MHSHPTSVKCVDEKWDEARADARIAAVLQRCGFRGLRERIRAQEIAAAPGKVGSGSLVTSGR